MPSSLYRIMKVLHEKTDSQPDQLNARIMNLISSAYDTTLMAIVILLFGQLERPKKVIPKNAPDQYHRNTEITENDFTPTQSDLKNVFVRCGGDESFLYTSCDLAGTKSSRWHCSKISSRPLADSCRSLPVRRPIPSTARSAISDAAISKRHPFRHPRSQKV